MIEQTFMNLQDKVNRPKFDTKKVDVNYPRFRRLVDEYVHWSQDANYTFDARERYEKDILSCLEEHSLDGYDLAEHLKDTVWVEPDADLVDILDDAFYVKDAIVKEMIHKWVKENFLVIPENVIGKKVNCKNGWFTYENYYITQIRPDTYEVTIDLDPNRKGGTIVGFETLTFID